MNEMLKVSGLNVSYGQARVLHHVSMHVAERELVAIVGANGAGKTTLLSAIAGLVPVNNGEVLFGGQDVTGMPAHRRP
jgi:branched-chain amino acid transport system ATP-binding protein